MFGLSNSDIRQMIVEAEKLSEIECVIIFGSRAMGNYKKGSDVDLAIVGKMATRDVARRLSLALNETVLLPYYFDVVSYREIQNCDLKAHIDENGIVLYNRG